eukprot:scaffold2633_cov139-Skeletonema_menzelii.AAC.8
MRRNARVARVHMIFDTICGCNDAQLIYLHDDKANVLVTLVVEVRRQYVAVVPETETDSASGESILKITLESSAG